MFGVVDRVTRPSRKPSTENTGTSTALTAKRAGKRSTPREWLPMKATSTVKVK